MGLYNADVYYELTDYVSQLKTRSNAELRREMEKGHLIASYGASATSTVLSSFSELKSMFPLLLMII